MYPHSRITELCSAIIRYAGERPNRAPRALPQIFLGVFLPTSHHVLKPDEQTPVRVLCVIL